MLLLIFLRFLPEQGTTLPSSHHRWASIPSPIPLAVLPAILTASLGFQISVFPQQTEGFAFFEQMFCVSMHPLRRASGGGQGDRFRRASGRPGVRRSPDRDGISPAAVRASGSARTRSGAETVRNVSLISKSFGRDQITTPDGIRHPAGIG